MLSSTMRNLLGKLEEYPSPSRLYLFYVLYALWSLYLVKQLQFDKEKVSRKTCLYNSLRAANHHLPCFDNKATEYQLGRALN